MVPVVRGPGHGGGGGLFFYLVECTLSIIYRNCPSSCADVHICTVYAVKEI